MERLSFFRTADSEVQGLIACCANSDIHRIDLWVSRHLQWTNPPRPKKKADWWNGTRIVSDYGSTSLWIEAVIVIGLTHSSKSKNQDTRDIEAIPRGRSFCFWRFWRWTYGERDFEVARYLAILICGFSGGEAIKLWVPGNRSHGWLFTYILPSSHLLVVMAVMRTLTRFMTNRDAEILASVIGASGW